MARAGATDMSVIGPRRRTPCPSPETQPELRATSCHDLHLRGRQTFRSLVGSAPPLTTQLVIGSPATVLTEGDFGPPRPLLDRPIPCRAAADRPAGERAACRARPLAGDGGDWFVIVHDADLEYDPVDYGACSSPCSTAGPTSSSAAGSTAADRIGSCTSRHSMRTSAPHVVSTSRPARRRTTCRWPTTCSRRPGYRDGERSGEHHCGGEDEDQAGHAHRHQHREQGDEQELVRTSQRRRPTLGAVLRRPGDR